MQIPKNWTFKSSEVAENFDSHVSEQLPWYPMVLDMLVYLARSYLPVNGKLVDLGCSTGAVTRELSDIISDRNVSALSIDNSAEMVNLFTGVGDIVCGDMMDIDLGSFDVATLNLSLMFTSVCERQKFIKKLISFVNVGGCIIVVDRIEPVYKGYLGLCLSRMSISNKILAGNDPAEILKKELSLTGIQRPTSESLFNTNGFDKWFQVGDFAGFVYEKRD